MSHYPSSAELARFRRSITLPPSTNHSPLAPHRGAWPRERTDGIGYRQTTEQTWAYRTWSDNPTIARREASAARSRAYAALDPQHYWLPDADSPTAAWDERRYGVPTLYRDCECCGNPAGQCDCYGIPLSAGTGSIVHGPEGHECYLCGKVMRHAAECDWNIERV